MNKITISFNILPILDRDDNSLIFLFSHIRTRDSQSIEASTV